MKQCALIETNLTSRGVVVAELQSKKLTGPKKFKLKLDAGQARSRVVAGLCSCNGDNDDDDGTSESQPFDARPLHFPPLL
jgi:hypothetical protein